ncbi:hypothetical protein ACS0TY_032292 [Phlomoides rotata]
MGTHRERIDHIEQRLDTMEMTNTYMKNIMDDIQRMVKRLVHRQSRNHRSRTHRSRSSISESSGEERESTGTELGGELNPTQEEGRGEHRERGQQGDERRKICPKLTCPTFNGTDALSWISRVNQYFKLNEIDKEEKV